MLATLPMVFLALTPIAAAASPTPSNIITSAEWSYQIQGLNVWTSCVTTDGQIASGLAYEFNYRGYTQTGTLDGNGCFTVTKQDVGPSFSYGVIYTLTVGSSHPTPFRVTSPKTLGATIVPVNKLSILLPTIGAISGATILGVGLYIARRKR